MKVPIYFASYENKINHLYPNVTDTSYVLQIILRRVCGERIDISLFDAVAMLADAADATEAEETI